jgi:hypothetical protein
MSRKILEKIEKQKNQAAGRSVSCRLFLGAILVRVRGNAATRKVHPFATPDGAALFP